MTNYSNFVSDFPSRCIDVLTLADNAAKLRGRDVTLILMVAAASIVVPYSRLTLDGKKLSHPSGDYEKFESAAARVEKLMQQLFLVSEIGPPATNSWHCGSLKQITGDPEFWPELTSKKRISSQKGTRSIIKMIRNALAHGSIFVRGNPIDEIIFVSKPSENSVTFNFISVSPDDFKDFLAKWVKFLEEENTFSVLREKYAA